MRAPKSFSCVPETKCGRGWFSLAPLLLGKKKKKKVRSQQLLFAEIWCVEEKKLSAWSVYRVPWIDEFPLLGDTFQEGDKGEAVGSNFKKCFPLNLFPIMAMVSLCVKQRWLEIQRRCWVRAEMRRRKCTFLQFTYGHSNKSKWLLWTPLFQGCIARIFSIIWNTNANSSLCHLPACSQGPFHVWMGKLTGAHVHIQCFRSTREAAEHKEICMYNICKFTLRSSEASARKKAGGV